MKAIFRDQTAQGLAEFALLIVLIAAVVSLALTATGVSLKEVYCSTVEGISGKNPCTATLSEDFSDISDWVGGWGKLWTNKIPLKLRKNS